MSPVTESQLPATPAEGHIETYDVSDALGTIRLASGEAVRFGRSACQFDPSVGLPVRVLTVQLGPLGNVKATRVELPAGMTQEPDEAVRRVSFLFRPLSEYTSWRLACALAESPQVPHDEDDIRSIRTHLATHRAKTEQDISEMVTTVRWARTVLNPVSGGTAESNGKVEQIVGDYDDLELALEVAQSRSLLSPTEVERLREVIARHMD